MTLYRRTTQNAEIECISSNIDTRRSLDCSCRGILRSVSYNIHRWSNSSRCGDIETDIYFSKDPTQFFTEIKEHSRDIGQIIVNGWGGSLGIFATCKYEQGRLSISEPQEPRLERVGLARQHFQSGYPELWALKETAKTETAVSCKEIKNLMENYEKVVIENIEDSFYDGGKNVVLSSKDNTYSPKHENDNFYYKENVLETVFTEANEYLQRGGSFYSFRIPDPTESAHTFTDSNGVSKTFRITTLTTGRLHLGCGTDIVMKELKRRCRELISKSDIQDIVSKYQDLTRQLGGNDNAKGFYQQIGDLWNGIYENRELLKGKCDDCPKRRLEV